MTKPQPQCVELVGWQDLADYLQRSVRDAQRFVDENPTFPIIRNGPGSPVRASAKRVEVWLEDYHAAFSRWKHQQAMQHAEMRVLHGNRFVYRPAEPPEVAAIQTRGAEPVKRPKRAKSTPKNVKTPTKDAQNESA